MKRLFTLANGRTYWAFGGYYQVSATPDDVPSGETGYAYLESIMRLKGDLPATAKSYAELDKLTEYRAAAAQQRQASEALNRLEIEREAAAIAEYDPTDWEDGLYDYD